MDVERLRSGKARDVVVDRKGSVGQFMSRLLQSFMQAVEQLRDVAGYMQQEIENHVRLLKICGGCCRW